VHLIYRLGYCRVAQSIGLVNTGPDQVSEPKEVEHFNQRTSTDTLVDYNQLHKRRVNGGNNTATVVKIAIYDSDGNSTVTVVTMQWRW
jgi:hypothetical protein